MYNFLDLTINSSLAFVPQTSNNLESVPDALKKKKFLTSKW